MLNDDICKLRERLNESIINNEDYNITYRTRRTNCKILQNNNNTKAETKEKKNKYKRNTRII